MKNDGFSWRLEPPAEYIAIKMINLFHQAMMGGEF